MQPTRQAPCSLQRVSRPPMAMLASNLDHILHWLVNSNRQSAFQLAVLCYGTAHLKLLKRLFGHAHRCRTPPTCAHGTPSC